jgi:hypothetical protein
MMTLSGKHLNLSVKIKRGGNKAFREYLNKKYKNSPLWKNHRWHQETRGYGDYLYFQDRDMFDEAISRAFKEDSDFADFKRAPWIV